MDLVKIGEFLKALRKSKGYTQQEVADELYVTQKTISRWENGEGVPDIAIITSVAEFYGVTVDELLKGEKNNYNQSIRTIEKKNKSKVKLITNKLLSTQNIYFLVSMSIIFIFLVSGIIVSLLVDSDSSAGLIIFTLGMIIGLITYLYGKSELKRIINDEDNLDLKDELNKAKLELRKKNVLFSDMYLLLSIIYIIFMIVCLTYVNLTYFTSYLVTGVIELLLLLFILCFIYLSFRQLHIKDRLNKITIQKTLISTMKICVIISIFTLFSVELYERNYNEGLNVYTINYIFSIFLMFNFKMSNVYLFRIISLILYIISMFAMIIGNKKNKLIFIIFSFVIGIVSNLIILLDGKNFPAKGFYLVRTNFTFIGVLTFLLSLGIGSYLLILKQKINQ